MSRIFHFEIPLAPSEIPASLPGQFSPSGQIFLGGGVIVVKKLPTVGVKNREKFADVLNGWSVPYQIVYLKYFFYLFNVKSYQKCVKYHVREAIILQRG